MWLGYISQKISTMANLVISAIDPDGASTSVTGVTVPSGSSNVGETNILPDADNGNGNLLVAQNISLGGVGTIQSLAFYVATASGNLRLGIYDATGPGGGPGALKAQTALFIPVAGWNIANVVAPVSLSAGTYWIAYFASSNVLAFRKATVSGTSGKYYALTFGALPATFSTNPSSTPSHWSFYAIFSGNVSIVFGLTKSPFFASLSIVGSAPSVFKTSQNNIQPASRLISIVGNSPTRVSNVVIQPAVDSATLIGNAPVIEFADFNITRQPPSVFATLIGPEPIVVTSSVIRQPASVSAAISGLAPIVSTSKIVQPSATSVVLSGNSPTRVSNVVIQPAVDSATLIGNVPTRVLNITRQPAVASAALSGVAPTVSSGGGVDAFWTVFTATSPTGEGSGFSGAGTRTIYISDSTGNDANLGTQASPKKSLAAGVAALRNGFPDWLLLKSGDTWTSQDFGEPNISGSSSSAKMLISSYGAGARPIVAPSADSSSAIGSFNFALSNLAIVGLDFYSYTRDPANPNYVEANSGQYPYGVRFLNTVNNFIIEDCIFRFFMANTIEGTSTNVKLRRNVFVDNYNQFTYSIALYLDNITGCVLEQNFFDHCGWNTTVPGAGPTYFEHSVYVQYHNGPTTVLGNIFTNAGGTGIQIRPGGTAIDNLICHCPIGLQIGSSPGTLPPPIPAGAATVTRNVILEGTDVDAQNPRGFAFVLYENTGLVVVQDNIMAHVLATGGNVQNVFIDTGATGDNITNNVIYQWGGPSKFFDFGSGNTTSPNEIDSTGYPDPTRSVASYAGTVGLTATLAAFVTAHRNRGRGVWNPLYSANAVNNYIAAGFGKSPI